MAPRIASDNVSGTWTITNNAVVTINGGISMNTTPNTPCTGTLNLDGGTLQIAGNIGATGNSYTTNTPVASVLNFNGGTLRFAAAATLSGGTADFYYVKSGGAVLDTSNNAVTISAALLTGGGADGGLTKLGSGTLTLGATNTYTGNTVVQNGMLLLSSAYQSNLASSAVTVWGSGAIAPTGTLDQSFLTWLSTKGTGGASITGAVLSGSSLAGGLTFSNALANAFLGAQGAAINVTNAITWTDGNTHLGGGNSNLTYMAAISSGNLIVGPVGGNALSTVILTNNANQPGWTLINSGMLQVGNGGAGGSLGACNITNNGVLAFNYTAGTYTNANLIAGSGGLWHNGASGSTIMVLTNGNNSFSGGTLNSKGQIIVTATGALGSGAITNRDTLILASDANVTLNNALVMSNATLTIAAGGSGTRNHVLNGAVTLQGSETFTIWAPHVLTISNAMGGAGSLTKGASAGTLVLAAANTYSGNTTNLAGILNLANQYAVSNSTVTMQGGTLTFASSAGTNFTLGGLAATTNGAGYDIGLTNGAGNAVALTVGGNNASTTYAGSLSGSGGSLIKIGTGTLTLGASNSFTGGLYIKAGTVVDRFLQGGDNGSWGPPSNIIYLGDAIVGADATLGTKDNGGYTAPSSTSPIIVVSGGGARTIRTTSNNYGNIGGNITLSNNLQFTTFSSSVGLKIGGNITGTGNLTFATTSGAGVVTLQGASINPVGIITNSSLGTGANIISGNIGANVLGVVQNSATSMLKLSGTNTYSGATTINSGTLQMGANRALPTNTTLRADNLGSVLDLNGYAQQVGGVSGTTGFGGIITNSSGTPVTLTVKFASGTNNFLGSVTGASTLTLTGGGTLQVSSGASFGGNTALVVTNGSTLSMNSTYNGALITAYSNSIVGGSGSISSTLLVTGGTYQPGYGSVLTQTVATLILTNSGTLAVTLAQTNNPAYVTVSSQLTLAGTNNYLRLSNPDSLSYTAGTITLVDYHGTGVLDYTNNYFRLADNINTIVGPNDGWALTNNMQFSVVGGGSTTNLFTINYDDLANGVITLTAVPEPGTASLLGLVGLAFLVRHLRRRRAQGGTAGA